MDAAGQEEQRDGAAADTPTVPLTIRIEPGVKRQLAAQAKAQGATTSLYVRRLIRESLTSSPQFFPNECAALGEVATQVKRVGRNVNQMAKRMNRAEHAGVALRPGEREELEELRGVLRDVHARLRSLEEASRARTLLLRRRGAGT